MGKQIPLRTSFNLPDGREVTLETGKLATQADGSVLVRMGDTMLLCTVVSAKKAKEGQPFFPLSVDYQEKFAAAGRIPGNFFRREGKLSDYEVLISRLVDRALRPLFPDGYMNETQVIITLVSADKDVMPDALAGLACSAAVATSDIPVEALFSEVRVARIDGQFVINPGRAALERADMDFIVAATKRDITMVEGEADECSEADLVAALKIAHEAIKDQIAAQERLAEMIGEKALVKRPLPEIPENEPLKARVESLASAPIYQIARSASDKHTRRDFIENLKDQTMETLETEFGEEFWDEWAQTADRYFEKLKKHIIRDVILSEGLRLDGRRSDEVRSIWCEVDYLPSSHGSSIFNRGETQSLTSLTLGTKQDQVLIDNALKSYDDDFILHYNFPPFSVGEARPQRGPGRREVGHANLAARSIRKVMPDEFAYTVRIVSDILESNGSSSMATVCAGSLALMDGGVPIKSAIAGIAMGAIADDKGRIAILTDILGDEDALGDMDFKVTGTEKGITGTQMDIKIDGMPYELLEKALRQARDGRLHILSKMAEAIAQPNSDLKPHAPRVVEFRIGRDYIGAVIGPGGKIIQEMQRQTGTTISIDEDEIGGIVAIFGPDKQSLDAAYGKIMDIVFVPEVGSVYEGVVEELADYGAFIKFKGKTGLMHVSEYDHRRIENLAEVLKVGDPITIKILDVDPKTGKMKLSRRAITPKPDGTMPTDEENAARAQRGGGGGRDGGRGGSGDRRGGGGRDDRRGGGGGDRRGGGGGGFGGNRGR
ncbi:MAG: polyribonucleotide nucleotidyltransferase [Haliscomenobacteraceae bacterium CHB4]|nr:Polyribonucleotide nucleotidyltransferase [Saprospiraceae bacterium]MCE7924187.1 polyribonucleotide nucleotidyltransferase [Haliscomenobacteraceae bacterium CHB4]